MQPKPGSLTSVDSDQVIDLSRPCDAQGSAGRTEPDAIHRRLGIEDGGVQNLAKSVIGLMENSQTGVKQKDSPTKFTATQKDGEGPTRLSSMISENSVSSNGVTDTSNLDCPPKSDKISEQKPVRLRTTLKTKRKNPKQAKKPTKKKKVTKKKYPIKDEDDFEIDPRLGGSKIKQSLSNKSKDKKVKSSDNNQEFKRNRTCDQRNPYIHIEGPWNLPNVVKIVNGSAKEDESEGKAPAKLTKAAQYVDEEHRSKAAKVGFSSTLSDRYDTHNRDATWVCVFCQHFTHTQCLGDLYGPYYINQVTPESIWFSKKNPDTLTNDHQDGDQFNRASSPSRSPAKKLKKSPKKRTSKEDPSNSETHAPPISEGSSELGKSDEKVEVWFHESCLVWAPGVCLIPPRLAGLDEAVSDAQQSVCEYCKKIGANIFCRSRGCGLRTHFPCAVNNDWTLHEETFLALCPSHTDQASMT